MLAEVLILLASLILFSLLCFRRRPQARIRLTPPQNQLFQAIKQDNWEQLQSLIKDQGVDINTKTYGGMNALFFAAEKGDVRMIEFLVGRGIEVGLKADNGDTPLRRAIYRNHIAATKVLLESSADMNESYRDKQTPLLVAISRDSSPLVALLLRSKCDLSPVHSPLGVRLLANSSPPVQAVVLKYEAWKDTKKVLFVYSKSKGRRPNLPSGVMRMVVAALASREDSTDRADKELIG